jgi:hypothetical protein
MAKAMINGKWVEIPDSTTDAEIRGAGQIDQGRTLIRRVGNDNYVIPPGQLVNVNDGDIFLDAPARIKG